MYATVLRISKFKSTDNLVSPLARVELALREHNIIEPNNAKVVSNKLIPLTRSTEDGTGSPVSQPTAEPATREQVKVSETLIRRVQSLAMYPISAEFGGNVACHAILNRAPETRLKKTAAGGTRVCNAVHGDSSGASVMAATFNR